MKVLLFIIVTTLTLGGCANGYMNKADQYNRAPSGFTEIVTAKRLSRMKPVQIIKMLKENCCDAVMFEQSKTLNWSVSDMEALTPYLEDESDSAPVSNTVGSVSCRGARYVSTVKREVQHLIRAFKEKKYPLAHCSTWDLKLDSDEK